MKQRDSINVSLVFAGRQISSLPLEVDNGQQDRSFLEHLTMGQGGEAIPHGLQPPQRSLQDRARPLASDPVE